MLQPAPLELQGLLSDGEDYEGDWEELEEEEGSESGGGREQHERLRASVKLRISLSAGAGASPAGPLLPAPDSLLQQGTPSAPAFIRALTALDQILITGVPLGLPGEASAVQLGNSFASGLQAQPEELGGSELRVTDLQSLEIGGGLCLGSLKVRVSAVLPCWTAGHP